jgi:Flp pilus assembly protein TadG
MISHLGRFARNSVGTAAIETAIFAPIFLVLTLGITDLGAGMFVKMQVNAAAQAGAAYAVINSSSAGCFPTVTGSCLTSIQTMMNNATGNSSFCTTAVCSASLTSCADVNGGICYTVSANYPYTPILPDAVYAWASNQTYSSAVTVRIQ